MTTASASGAPRITSTGSPRSEPRAEVLGNSSDQTPASHAEYLQRDRGFGALQLVTTGVAGPVEQEGRPVGTVVLGLALPGSVPDAVELRLPGDRKRVRQLATISALDALRRRLRATGQSA